MIQDGQVLIVDEFTGRLMPGRRWSDGLHQAVEAKEGVKVERENQTLATITLQNYFRMYSKLAGMTGTASTEAAEFEKIYSLDVVAIPTNRPMVRIDEQDLIYRTEREKFEAVVEEVSSCSEREQPVLVGTISIEKSEHLSRLLSRRGVKHVVLNAKYHEREAEIVAQAGVAGSVTIATNMAGRGTDIILGGNPEYRADPLLREAGYSRLEGVGSLFLGAALRGDLDSARRFAAEHPKLDDALIEKIVSLRDECRENHEKVVALGGLHILGTERHESRRIDNQLRGRSGRQGDPGTSRFYLSLEDDLMRIFGSDRLQGLMQRLGMEEGIPIEHSWVTKSIERAQKQVEARNFDSRKHLLEYDDVMNKQREAIYTLRKEVLEGKNEKEFVAEATERLVGAIVDETAPSEKVKGQADWKVAEFESKVREVFSLDVRKGVIDLRAGRDAVRASLLELAFRRYAEIEALVGKIGRNMRETERSFILDAVDHQWRDHLLALDHLKEGIGLRGYGQRDPLVEYKKESFDLFEDLLWRLDEQVIGILFGIIPRLAAEEAARQAAPDQEESDVEPSSSSGWTATTTRPAPAPPSPGAPHPSSPASAASTATSGFLPQRRREDFVYDGSALGAGDAGPKAPKAAKTTKVGRNDPCPCGSGKKFKKCHIDDPAYN
jgi:preprotein translocase subunit SecA